MSRRRALATPLKRRAEICSALRTMAWAFDRLLSDLPADPARIRRRLEGLSPVSAGIKKAPWQNVRSLVLVALKRVGATSMSNRHNKAMPPEWRALYDRLEAHRHRAGLSRFMRFCSELGVLPERVDDAERPTPPRLSSTLLAMSVVGSVHRV